VRNSIFLYASFTFKNLSYSPPQMSIFDFELVFYNHRFPICSLCSVFMITLEQYNIDTSLLSSYFQDISQYVAVTKGINIIKSAILLTELGLVQGSCLSNLLFLDMMNDFPSVFKKIPKFLEEQYGIDKINESVPPKLVAPSENPNDEEMEQDGEIEELMTTQEEADLPFKCCVRSPTRVRIFSTF